MEMNTVKNNAPEKVLYFDGVCNLCSSFVQFVIRHDRKQEFRFASLQSAAGQAVLKSQHLSTEEFHSTLLYDGQRYLLKSDVALTIFKSFGGAWSLLYGFMIVPRFIRDWVYDVVAKNRYRWFGKKDACMIPTPALKSRFLN